PVFQHSHRPGERQGRHDQQGLYEPAGRAGCRIEKRHRNHRVSFLPQDHDADPSRQQRAGGAAAGVPWTRAGRRRQPRHSLYASMDTGRTGRRVRWHSLGRVAGFQRPAVGVIEWSEGAAARVEESTSDVEEENHERVIREKEIATARAVWRPTDTRKSLSVLPGLFTRGKVGDAVLLNPAEIFPVLRDVFHAFEQKPNDNSGV